VPHFVLTCCLLSAVYAIISIPNNNQFNDRPGTPLYTALPHTQHLMTDHRLSRAIHCCVVCVSPVYLGLLLCMCVPRSQLFSVGVGCFTAYKGTARTTLIESHKSHCTPLFRPTGHSSYRQLAVTRSSCSSSYATGGGVPASRRLPVVSYVGFLPAYDACQHTVLYP